VAAPEMTRSAAAEARSEEIRKRIGMETSRDGAPGEANGKRELLCG
jgi:hypothetical protein